MREVSSFAGAASFWRLASRMHLQPEDVKLSPFLRVEVTTYLSVEVTTCSAMEVATYSTVEVTTYS